MGEWLYFVKLGSDEERPKLGSSEVLVQLICDDLALRHETNRRSSASKLAKHAVGLRYPYLEEIGYADASLYSGNSQGISGKLIL
jgi:hypothetical protein